MKTLRYSLLLVLSVTCGCINVVRMTKVTDKNPNPDGVRVCLPQRFLVGRTTTNGSLVYSVEMLPDPQQEYAIDGYAILGKQSLGVHRSIEGYMTGLDMSGDSTGTAVAGIAAAGQLAQAYYSAQASSTNQSGTTKKNGGGKNKAGGNSTGDGKSAGDSNSTDSSGTSDSNSTGDGKGKKGGKSGNNGGGGGGKAGAKPGNGNNGDDNAGGKTDADQPGPVRVMYRIIDDQDQNGIQALKLQPVQLPIFNYYFLDKDRVEPADKFLLPNQ